MQNQSIIDRCCFEKLRKITNTIKLTSKVSSGELLKGLGYTSLSNFSIDQVIIELIEITK